MHKPQFFALCIALTMLAGGIKMHLSPKPILILLIAVGIAELPAYS